MNLVLVIPIWPDVEVPNHAFLTFSIQECQLTAIKEQTDKLTAVSVCLNSSLGFSINSCAILGKLVPLSELQYFLLCKDIFQCDAFQITSVWF